MAASYLLSRKHQVFLFESQNRIGGHTHTVQVESAGQSLNIDTGFIVFNNWTYPNFIKILEQIGVEAQDSSMSFSVKCESSGLEYNGTTLNSLFAQRRNLLNPKFLKMIQEILRFNRELSAEVDSLSGNETLGQYLRQRNYSEYFCHYYILPMGSAIWSAGLKGIEDFPLKTFGVFFKNHGMLSVDKRPTWKVIKNGSKAYIPALTSTFADRIQLANPVTSVARKSQSIKPSFELTFANGSQESFDEVVMACHSDEALKILQKPSQAEREVLEAIPYQANDTVLHTDTSILPKNERAWAAWNYFVPKVSSDSAMLTYHMNILQNLKSDKNYLVTLNSTHKIDPKKILRQLTYHHPVYDLASDQARRDWEKISGINGLHFAGAYWRNGFHEDGVWSAVRVAEQFGISL